MKNFNQWNEVKKRTDSKIQSANFKERDIFWGNVGMNIGFEQNGKGSDFMRPILVFRKYSHHMFLGIPLSTTIKEGSFFFTFSFQANRLSSALLVQARTFDAKRLDRKIGMIHKDDFQQLEIKMKELMRL